MATTELKTKKKVVKSAKDDASCPTSYPCKSLRE
jgi:hypothetical protein